nr:DUF222 domain-containing protein [Mycobacterium sp. URHB0044]
MWGQLPATSGAASDTTLDDLANSVCRDDPRTKTQRRADAIDALNNRATNLACACGTPNCPAGEVADGRHTQIVIHVLTEKATVEADGAKPGYLPGFGAVPADTVRKLAKGAKIRPVKQPKDFAAESGYRPSAALADYIRCRDLTCRWPNCDKPAEASDLDHTVPYPFGPTHPANLKAYCRTRQLLDDERSYFYVPDLRTRRIVGVMSQSYSTEIDEYVRRVVDAAPPLTEEQRAKLATLLDMDATSTPTANETNSDSH